MVKLRSKVIVIQDWEPFEGKLVAKMHPLSGMEDLEETLYRVELLDRKWVDVTAHEFVGRRDQNAEETE